jgi:hypothetical protein
VTSEFMELVCADPGWLHAEFDAIMTADFGALPPRPPMPRPGSAGPRRPGQVPRTAARSDGVSVGVVVPAAGICVDSVPLHHPTRRSTRQARGINTRSRRKQVIPAQRHPDCARLAAPLGVPAPRTGRGSPGRTRPSRLATHPSRSPPDGTADGAAARVICRRWSAQRDHRAALLLERSSTNRL